MSYIHQGFCSAVIEYTKQLLHDLFGCYDTPRATIHNRVHLYRKYLRNKTIECKLCKDREYEWFYIGIDTRNTYMTIRFLPHDKPNRWGYDDWYYDGPHPVLALGPFLSISWGLQ